jgi:hypothetical protein
VLLATVEFLAILAASIFVSVYTGNWWWMFLFLLCLGISSKVEE